MQKKGINKLSLFLIPIGIAVNFVLGTIVILLKLPIYLDAVGTIVVGALCGYIPGIIVGLVSNILTSLASPINMFYAILNVGFGILAAFLSKKGWFKNFGLTLLSAIFFALIGGGIGACITWVVYGFDFGTGTSAIFSIPLHEVVGLPKFLAQFVAETGMDVVDKVATVIVSFFVLKAMPTRFLAKLPLGPIYIKDADKLAEDED